MGPRPSQRARQWSARERLGASQCGLAASPLARALTGLSGSQALSPRAADRAPVSGYSGYPHRVYTHSLNSCSSYGVSRLASCGLHGAARPLRTGSAARAREAEQGAEPRFSQPPRPDFFTKKKCVDTINTASAAGRQSSPGCAACCCGYSRSVAGCCTGYVKLWRSIELGVDGETAGQISAVRCVCATVRGADDDDGHNGCWHRCAAVCR